MPTRNNDKIDRLRQFVAPCAVKPQREGSTGTRAA